MRSRAPVRFRRIKTHVPNAMALENPSCCYAVLAGTLVTVLPVVKRQIGRFTSSLVKRFEIDKYVASTAEPVGKCCTVNSSNMWPIYIERFLVVVTVTCGCVDFTASFVEVRMIVIRHYINQEMRNN